MHVACDSRRGRRRLVLGTLGLTALATAIAGCPSIPGLGGGNRPPIVGITGPTTDVNVDAGETTPISYEGSDGEDQARITIYVDEDEIPNSGNEIVLRDDLFIGPGTGQGTILWDTDGVPPASYFVFAEITDNVNAPVRAIGLGRIQVVPEGTGSTSSPPSVQFIEPIANLGVASGDTITVRYRYQDPDSSVRLTLLLDKDRNPSNDDVNNPGDPLNPDSNIIVLPSTARLPGDPVLADPVDNTEIRTNPRSFQATTGGAFSTEKTYLFTIDFARIPVRPNGEPYFVRATIDDSDNRPVHVYANSALTITGLAAGFVDLSNVGRTVAGARFQGFSTLESLGSQILANGDSDNDTIEDFVLAGRFGSPRNRQRVGSAYLIRGRRKTPFPVDTNSNGLPDGQVDAAGVAIDFPQPPPFISLQAPQPQLIGPYQPQNVGRFGGTISINSVGSFFRGVTYAMPEPLRGTTPPDPLRDPRDPNLKTSGLTSITVGDYTADGVPDLLFGIPFVSGAQEHLDDDPCDGMDGYLDGLPNQLRCDGPPCTNDDMFLEFNRNGCAGDQIAPPDQGMVILVSGANDLENDGSANDGGSFSHNLGPDGVVFRLIVDAGLAGQFDPEGSIDDEGFINRAAQVPLGSRFRGGWFQSGSIFIAPVDSTNEYGHNVARLPSFDNDTFDELLISVPGDNFERGRVDLWNGQNLLGAGFYSGGTASMPGYACLPAAFCVRALVNVPTQVQILGEQSGDRFGYSRPGGQINQDGTTDVLAGAPGADRAPNGVPLTDCGVFYVLFTPAGGFGNTDLSQENIPRLEVWGTHGGDRFGEVQDAVGDINGDGIEDVAFASPTFDDDLLGNNDAGYVGVIFGARPITGENVFLPEQVGTPALSGVRFLGATANARAGTSIASAGDFNQDGFGDLLITSPGETRLVPEPFADTNTNGIYDVGESFQDRNGDGIYGSDLRRGVTYLVFGSPNLTDRSINLSEVGNPDVPGVVFVSPFVLGTADEASTDVVGGIGDVDGDGFDDIAIGLPTADFVNPAAPAQRRTDSGEVYLVYGSNFGSNELPETP